MSDPFFCDGARGEDAAERRDRDARERVTFKSVPVAPTVAAVAADAIDAP